MSRLPVYLHQFQVTGPWSTMYAGDRLAIIVLGYRMMGYDCQDWHWRGCYWWRISYSWLAFLLVRSVSYMSSRSELNYNPWTSCLSTPAFAHDMPCLTLFWLIYESTAHMMMGTRDGKSRIEEGSRAERFHTEEIISQECVSHAKSFGQMYSLWSLKVSLSFTRAKMSIYLSSSMTRRRWQAETFCTVSGEEKAYDDMIADTFKWIMKNSSSRDKVRQDNVTALRRYLSTEAKI